MRHPTIHSNGTSKESLVEQWRDAYLALLNARSVLCGAAPHSRDYYPQGGCAYEMARAEHYARLVKIQAVMDELDELSLRAQFPI